MSSLEIATLINKEDATVASAVQRALPQVARAIDDVVAGLRHGGRLIYVGAGTSGRLGVLDASEIPPTFSASPELFIGLIAGGDRALRLSSEHSEDSPELGAQDLALNGFAHQSRPDTLVGIAASGRTPFTIAAVEYARRHGAQTIAVTCNRSSPLSKAAHVAIVTEVGPEVIAGSTRMKAGTAQKVVLNLLSTLTMIRLGRVYRGLMVDMRTHNAKLVRRATNMVGHLAPCDEETAKRAFDAANGDLKLAVLLARGIEIDTARTLMRRSGGRLRSALAEH